MAYVSQSGIAVQLISGPMPNSLDVTLNPQIVASPMRNAMLVYGFDVSMTECITKLSRYNAVV